MTTQTHKETLGFQAEVKQLLKLMAHSLYGNKEIFLRELISNASDAADKLRFEALSDDALYEDDSNLRIRVAYDKDARTITVSDNGIGMSRAEVIDNIGTIAKSGTRQFFESLSGDQAKDANLIGQFGVGFYSAFVVADRVTVLTRHAGLTAEHGVVWESGGEGEYSVETIERPQRGTEVILHLREGEDELLDGYRLRSIVRKYSDHITLPIVMDKDNEGEKKDKEDETVNQASALWARPKSEITQEQHEEFYKHVAHDFEAPLAYTHSRVEGKQEYTLLLYVPAHAPFDLWDRDRRHGIKLYIRRVFVMDDADKLLPHYLRFVRGIIDSNDLPLNISREILQQSKDVDAIRAGVVKKVLGLLEEIAESDKDKYKTFWSEFGRVLKEGVGEDFANRERIAKLLRFSSTATDSDEQDVSLGDYVGRMKQGQEKIYYITADGFNAAKNSPHLEIFRGKGIEVLLLSDRVDEWVASNMTEFQGKPLQSVAKGELDIEGIEGEGEQNKHENDAKEFKALIGRIQDALSEKVKEVRVTHRLTSSAACLVADQHALSANLERMLKVAGHPVPGSKPILEVNPHHALVSKLDRETDAARFADWSRLLFDQAVLSEGGQLEDPAGFVKRLNDLLGVLTEEKRIITL
ncbi:MAG: molecular chaperone HtpG [Burkholderiales bacterium]